MRNLNGFFFQNRNKWFPSLRCKNVQETLVIHICNCKIERTLRVCHFWWESTELMSELLNHLSDIQAIPRFNSKYLRVECNEWEYSISGFKCDYLCLALDSRLWHQIVKYRDKVKGCCGVATNCPKKQGILRSQQVQLYFQSFCLSSTKLGIVTLNLEGFGRCQSVIDLLNFHACMEWTMKI